MPLGPCKNPYDLMNPIFSTTPKSIALGSTMIPALAFSGISNQNSPVKKQY